MALGFSGSEIARFRSTGLGRTRASSMLGTGITTLEVGAASFAFGLAQGKFGGVALFGLPVDLLTGLGLHILAFAGVGGRYTSHLHAFGDGALASFAAGWGRQVGRQIQTPADRARIASSVQGQLPDGGTTGGASLADEELARMVAAGRK